jgi:hypothetical protein
MGWCWRSAFKWFEERKLVPYMCTVEWFIHCLNGTTAEMLIKCYEKIRLLEEENIKLKEKLKEN